MLRGDTARRTSGMLWWLVPLSVLWLVVVVHDLLALRHLPSLPPRPPDAEPRDATVVMAVRDDVAHVGASVQSLLQQQHVDLRVVVVDDRSRDGTGEMLARLAANDPRLRIVTVRELPPDWLGKTHALHVGAADVTTRWLLFVDGDTRLAPDALARAIAAAEQAGADHVTLAPAQRHTTLAGRACLLAFLLPMLRLIVLANATPQRAFVGAGAFNLVRTEAYRKVGGHAALRLEIVDDAWLGRLLFRAGCRSRVWLAVDALDIEWGGTPRELVRVTTKNGFAGMRYHTLLACAVCLLVFTLCAAPLAAPLLVGAWGWLPFGACVASVLPAMALARRQSWSPTAGLLVPIARLLLPVAILNSVFVTLRQGGVRWRDTFYPLAQLRRGMAGKR